MHRKRINISQSITKAQPAGGVFKNSRIYVLIAVCGIMAIAAIFLTIDTSTNGAEVASLQIKEKELLARQQELQETLVSTLSVNSLKEKSAELGFVKTTNLVYVTTSSDTANSLINNEPVAKLR